MVESVREVCGSVRVVFEAFESSVVSEDWRSAVIVPLYKGKGGLNVRTIQVLAC